MQSGVLASRGARYIYLIAYGNQLIFREGAAVAIAGRIIV
jgi:hypothetical protein